VGEPSAEDRSLMLQMNSQVIRKDELERLVRIEWAVREYIGTYGGFPLDAYEARKRRESAFLALRSSLGDQK
jgi:hypothetical protein